MNKYVNSEKGVGSLMAVISLTLLMVIVGGIATMTIANSHENKNNKDNMQIQYAAEAGLKKALVSFANNEDGQSFKWLPDNDTLDDNGIIVKETSTDGEAVKTNLHKYKEGGDAKASYAVYICKEDSENPGKLIKVNDNLKNGIKPVKGTTYYITAYGFINSGNDKKKIASAKYVYNGGGNNSGVNDSSNGGIALYSDDSGSTAIDGLRTNKFDLIHGTKIAARGVIPIISDLENNKVVYFDGVQIKNMEEASKQVLVETPLTPPYPYNYPKEYKYDIDFNYPDLSYKIKSKNIETNKNVDNVDLVRNNNSISNINIDSANSDLQLNNNCIISSSKLKLRKFEANNNITINNSYIEVDSLTLNGCEINNSTIIVRGNGLTMFRGNNHFVNSVIKITGNMKTEGGNIIGNCGILDIGGTCEITMSCYFDNVFLKSNGNITINTVSKIDNSFICCGGDLLHIQTSPFLTESLILARNNVQIQGGWSPDKKEDDRELNIKSSYIKACGGDITLLNATSLKGIILAKGKFNFTGCGHRFEYYDNSLSNKLNLSDLVEDDSNILKPFGYFVERLKAQEEVADPIISYGQDDYAGTQKINND